MQDAFVYVLFGTVIFGVIAAIISFAMAGKAYEDIGKGGLFDDPDQMKPSGGGGGSFSAAERDAEVRDMLESRNRRRIAAGKEALDVDAEIKRLSAPVGLDPTLLAEIREHVENRNARRIRRGHEPLDVEAEVRRQAEEFGA